MTRKDNDGQLGNSSIHTTGYILCVEKIVGHKGFTNYATSTIPIMHLICPPKFCMTFVFHFSLGITAVPREIENNAYAKFGGTNKVHYGECGSGIFRPQGFLKMADDQTGSVRDICSKVAVPIDSNQ